ncbi:MAG: type II toxin-antitoxin system Phd/YefM family antitoxin [bacterium]|nr:type II toxin-antitoxin system Phd/YefM family antitoxin [bacterium]
MNILSISDLRSQLPTAVADVSTYMKRIAVSVSGKPKAVLISIDELESLEETAEIMSAPGAYESIMKGSAQAKKGEGITLDEYIKS